VYMCTSLPFVLASREICIVIWNKGHDLNYMFDLSIGLCLHVSWLEAFGLQMLWKAWMNDTTHTLHSFTCELCSQQNKTSSELDLLEQKTSVNGRSPTLNSMDCPQICHGPVISDICQNQTQTGSSWTIHFSLIASVFSHQMCSYLPVYCSWYGLLWAETITSDDMCSYLTKFVPKLY
jgi:hypothetical protein